MTKKVKGPGDNVIIRLKSGEKPDTLKWINAQDNLAEAFRFLVEKETMLNDIINYGEIIPGSRSDKYIIEQIVEQFSDKLQAFEPNVRIQILNGLKETLENNVVQKTIDKDNVSKRKQDNVNRVQPETPKTEVKPETPKTEIQQEAPKTEVKPETSKTEVQPETPKTEVKPETSKTEVQQEAPKTEVKPETPKTEVQPETPKTEIKPETSKTEVQPEGTPRKVESKDGNQAKQKKKKTFKITEEAKQVWGK